MKLPLDGAIDCDLHPAMPSVPALLPYLDDYWRDQFANRHIDKLPFTLSSYPPSSPLSARPDWRAASGSPGGDLDAIRRQALDPLRRRATPSATRCMAPSRCSTTTWRPPCARRSTTGWPSELLDREPRLRASILVPAQSPELAVARDRARRRRSALRAGAAAGDGRDAARPARATGRSTRRPRSTSCRSASTPAAPIGTRRPMSGWPSYRVEDYVAQSAAFETQLLSLIAEGVFQKFPKLKVVLIEFRLHLAAARCSGAPTRPGAACAPEVPWIDRSPAEIVREHVRFTLQPVDAPRQRSELLARTLEHIGSDRIAAVLDRLSALAVRRRGRLAGRAARGHNTQAADRQSARDLSAFARGAAAAVGMAGQRARRRSHEHRRSPGGRGPAARRSSTATFTPRTARPPSCIPSCRQRWREHMATFGTHFRHGLTGQLPYPRMMAARHAHRRVSRGRARRAPTSS